MLGLLETITKNLLINFIKCLNILIHTVLHINDILILQVARRLIKIYSI